MEIAKNGATLSNDVIQMMGSVPLPFGGSLTVSNLGPSALDSGSAFHLFTASSFSGAFSSITLPTLPTGLMWTNQLLINGNIVVVPKTSPSLSALAKVGTNLVFNVSGGSPGNPWSLLSSTNAALPVSSWSTNRTGIFDWLGDVTITNGITTNESRRFFLIYAP